MDKFLDVILGVPGIIIFMILICAGAALTAGHESEKDRCEKAGGKYVQTMKSYHTCKIPIKEQA